MRLVVSQPIRAETLDFVELRAWLV